MENAKRKLFGIQFHPEVVHTPHGKESFSNFVHKICDCGKNWTMRSYVDQAVEEIRAQVGKEPCRARSEWRRGFQRRGALLHKAIGDQLYLHFRQQRLLRAKKRKWCRKFLAVISAQVAIREHGQIVFLTKLKGVTDPERKRKIIGKTFIEVFQARPSARARQSFLRKERCIPT